AAPLTHGGEQTLSVFALERREIEKTGDTVRVEQVCVTRVAREAHGDERNSRTQRVALPARQRRGCQQIIITNDRVEVAGRNQRHRLLHADTWHGLRAEVVEVATQMLSQKRMSGDAHHTHGSNIPNTARAVQRRNNTSNA